ncbi:similar to Saccharomyces cerevisiae YNL221C POP1 Subunit of both RNase MRP and nuclear RNase P [Maudiozyma saulgeensis]|uniref:Similar to Saccharomyces cerevisiae YNL221C POP1 Subunit of both RNase MRP and nuclear RNase P n=1 Tax=Maudiozyma saulgeensis TaxID=1789683 RepID=A0A1X7R2F7_9SACH|nr:similar to Saccharomyces cerevisiae YNL221C POP1 Subunit of both RNase MRP and nuclear RNase P [Kazachstania saulgeensis]
MAVQQSANKGGKKQYNKNQIQKRQRIYNARSIRAEAIIASSSNKDKSTNDLSESGSMLNVDKFINSRQFEIKELQLAMHRSKVSGSTRVFQALPRRLRRRTASHNIKRIPKRMRNRALREMMKNDQERTGANSTKPRHGLTSKALYKAKMSIKLLRLASKSKSMKLALPNEVSASKNRVRQKIRTLQRLIKDGKRHKKNISKLNNVMGSYDNVGVNTLAKIPRGRPKYVKRQLKFTWLPTHVWNAKRSHMIKRWGYQIPWSATQKCFKMTHRIGSNVATSDGTLCMDTSYLGTIIINAKEGEAEQLKETISKLTNSRGVNSKYYKSKKLFQGLIHSPVDGNILGPGEVIWVDEVSVLLRLHPTVFGNVFSHLLTLTNSLKIQDARFSISSITLTGAESLTALTSVLRSTSKSESFEQLKLVSNVTDCNVLPQNLNFGFTAIDPRHFGSPKKIKHGKDQLNIDEVMKLQTNEPKTEIYETLSKLLSQSGRTESYKGQLTMKELNKRRHKMVHADSNVADNGIIPFEKGKDPEIPLYIYKREESNDWVILLPWFWHLPLWYQLNRIPRMYNIGLRQFQQLQYENSKLYFPDDYPFTEAGSIENAVYKRETSRSKWEGKPSGKRVNFSKIKNIHNTKIPSLKGEIGDFFSCDWRFLQVLRNGVSYLSRDGKSLAMINPNRTTQFDQGAKRLIEVVNDLFELSKDLEVENLTIPRSKLPICLSTNSDREPKLVRTKEDICNIPLSVLPVRCKYVERGHMKDNARIYEIPKEHEKYWKEKRNGTFRPDGKLFHDEKTPLVEVYNLIGFISSGAYDLSIGGSCGTGFVDESHFINSKDKYVLVRNVGSNQYRLALLNKLII